MKRTDANGMGWRLDLATGLRGFAQPGRKFAALALVAAGSAIAMAGGTPRCRIVLTPGIAGQHAQAAGASGLSSAAVAGTLGYCPGGFDSGPRKHSGDLSHADGQAAKSAAAYAMDDADERGIDALDAANIAKAAFAYDATRIRSVKLEALDGDLAKAGRMWKVELRTPDMTDWCIVLEPETGVVVLKRGRNQDGTPVSDGEIDDLALKNPEHLKGAERYTDVEFAKSIDDVVIQPVGRVADDLKGEDTEMSDAFDLFEAIELVADKAAKKDPEPVPADKITDRPQPKTKDSSTGSRW